MWGKFLFRTVYRHTWGMNFLPQNKIWIPISRKNILIKLNKDIVDPDDVEMLQDLIITCVNDALSKVDSATEQQMGKFNIPGIM